MGKADPPALAGLPNALTVLRAVAALPIVTLLLVSPPRYGAAFTIFVIAALSDLVDGLLARRLGRSTFGAKLDPIADKILVLSALIALWSLGQLTIIAAVATLAIAARELIVLGLRMRLSARGRELPVSGIAKLKTFVQMAGTGLLLAAAAWPQAGPISLLGTCVIAAAALLSIASLIDYVFEAKKAKPRLP